MSTTPDGNTYFYVRFGEEKLKFGVPVAMAQKVVNSTKKAISKKVSLATAIENGEKAIAEAFRKGLHRNAKASKNIAPFIISCCLLSQEGLENPDAGGFILEISPSMFPSWSTEAHDDPPGEPPKTYVHYKAVAGRDEIEAVMAPRGAAAPGPTPAG